MKFRSLTHVSIGLCLVRRRSFSPKVPLESILGQDCWDGDITYYACCHTGDSIYGNDDCWNEEFSYFSCCLFDSLENKDAQLIWGKYDVAKKSGHDISDHLDNLRVFAAHVMHITQFGVRGFVSTWAFLQGLSDFGTSSGLENRKSLISYDIMRFSRRMTTELTTLGDRVNIAIVFHEKDVLSLSIDKTDLLFIDTFHARGQLIRELALHSARVGKYIIMHDTTTYGEESSCAEEASACTEHGRDCSDYCGTLDGWSDEDRLGGLWHAVELFLRRNSEWRLLHRYKQNNGLTILERVAPEPYLK